MFDVRSLTVPGVMGVDHVSEGRFLPKLQHQMMAPPSPEHACVPGVVIVQIFSSSPASTASLLPWWPLCTVQY